MTRTERITFESKGQTVRTLGQSPPLPQWLEREYREALVFVRHLRRTGAIRLSSPGPSAVRHAQPEFIRVRG